MPVDHQAKKGVTVLVEVAYLDYAEETGLLSPSRQGEVCLEPRRLNVIPVAASVLSVNGD